VADFKEKPQMLTRKSEVTTVKPTTWEGMERSWQSTLAKYL